ncbi:hypothetical protein DV736_g707, partial [Chaetothyriales sp. CBS 134916]
MSRNSNPDLDDALRQLDEELEEGDITRKGYEKRRTWILSQYGAPSPDDLLQVHRGGLRIHSPDNSDHPASNDGSRAASLAALTGGRSASGMSASRNGTMSDVAAAAAVNRPVQAVRESSYGVASVSSSSFDHQRQSSMLMADSGTNSRTQTLLSQNFAFNPDAHANMAGHGPSPTAFNGTDARPSPMLDSQQGYFSDFAGQQREEQAETYGGALQRYSQTELISPTLQAVPPLLSSSDLAGGAAVHQMPLEPREVPFAICDPHDSTFEMARFENIAVVLRHRAKTNPKQPAYWVLDSKGKEVVSITWEKLHSRAEKVAQVIRDKSSLYRGDRVALVYTEAEIIEFAVAMMGCFLAGVVAVPINDLANYPRLNVILTSTQAHLALTTEANLKNFQRDLTATKQGWPRGVEWWKTNEFGSYHPKKKSDERGLVVPDLAYIEFSTAPTGDLRGVVISHKTIMHQMATLSAMVISATPNTKADTFNPSLRDKQGHLITGRRTTETMLSYLDPRQGIGMILAVLLNVYGGHTVQWFDCRAIETPGLYAHLITKHQASLLVADYPGLKRAVLNYQADPMTTRNFKKNMDPNFSSVKLCMIDTLTVDGEFHELLADRWLRPLRNPRAREIVAPMLCLPEHGGMIISMRDWLGGEDRMGCILAQDLDHGHDGEQQQKEASPVGTTHGAGFGSSLIGGGPRKPVKQRSTDDLGEVLLDKEALKTNDIVVLAMGSEARAKAASYPNAVRCSSFGYPIPDATLAVVDPESGLLCSPNSVGEIWVDSPSLSGGFWALPRHTETIFHARPYCFQEGNPTPTEIDPEFLRTGLLGCVIEGKVYVLGLYEDRLRQRVEWVEHGQLPEHRYFFVQHLVLSIMKNVPKIHDCSAFDCFVNDEHLPIVLLESASASTAPVTSGGPPRQLDIALLDSLAERTMEVLYQEHHLRVYCVLITQPGILPRVTKNGRREIGNMLCRREFDNGNLPCVHVKFGVERAVQNLPTGQDVLNGMWSPAASANRADLLYDQDTQWSGIDHREVVIDERTSTTLTNFTNIFDLMQWRVTRQPDDLAYCTIDGRGKEGKALLWKKFDLRVASVAMYLKNKVKLKPGDHVVLMYTHSEEYVFAVYASIVLGLIMIPVAPLDVNRLSEDAPAYLHIVADMGVKAVLCNHDVDQLFKQKLVSQHLKQSAQYLKTHIPPVFNTTKPSKQSHGCRDLGLTIDQSWTSPTNPVLIWTYWTPDQRRISVRLGHDTILGMCKVQKETCQMTSSKPVLGCVRSTMGIGFIHTVLMGVYNGSRTYLLSPLDFAQNPQILFLALSRYKVKDTYATAQMLDFAMSRIQPKGFSLHELKNMMIINEGRPRQDLFMKVKTHFAQTRIERTVSNTIYSHVLNPMIASRSYMSIEPIELWLDTRALRRGLIFPVDPDSDPSTLLVQDSGMVPVSTRIAIVNPETCQLCRVGEFGEIWVQSEACAKSFYLSKQAFDEERFNGRIYGGDPNSLYVRTGDLGFLHTVTRPIGPGNQPVEMQILFVLGSIGETFDVNGLNHFPVDIENSVEKCHRNITPGGCAVFQAGGMVVVLVEVYRKAYLASIVPVIVNAILNEHQIVVDIVAFVGQGDFPRSRLSEKQRGKILANWVTRKLRTIAQFGIRDGESGLRPLSEAPEPHKSNSVVSRTVSNRELVRDSITSETHAPGDLSSRSSIMPELPLELPPNSHHLDIADRFGHRHSESDQAIPALAVNSTPYHPPEGVAEMSAAGGSPPESSHNPYLTDEKFYDPEMAFPHDNLHGESQSGLPQSELGPAARASSSDNGPPRLTLVNPDYYPVEKGFDNTPSSYSATATPGSAIPRSAGGIGLDGGHKQRDEDSPFGDTGNPFASSIPGSVGGFDYASPRSLSGRYHLTSSAATSGAAASSMYSSSNPLSPSDRPARSSPSHSPARRSLLPSQLARLSQYMNPSDSGSAVSNPLEHSQHQYADGHSLHRPEGQGFTHHGLFPAAGATGSASGGASSRNSNSSLRDQNVDEESLSGSVKHRYDGSGYPAYEY